MNTNTTHRMQFLGTCRYFNGIMNEICDKGINYRQLVGGEDFGLAMRLPCFKEEDSTGYCDLREFPSEKEGEEYEQKVNQAIKDFLEVLAGNICPMCDQPVKEKIQVGRCVYGKPCGHRLYQSEGNEEI